MFKRVLSPRSSSSSNSNANSTTNATSNSNATVAPSIPTTEESTLPPLPTNIYDPLTHQPSLRILSNVSFVEAWLRDEGLDQCDAVILLATPGVLNYAKKLADTGMESKHFNTVTTNVAVTSEVVTEPVEETAANATSQPEAPTNAAALKATYEEQQRQQLAAIQAQPVKEARLAVEALARHLSKDISLLSHLNDSYQVSSLPVQCIVDSSVLGGRLIVAPVQLYREWDDVRRVNEAVRLAMERVKATGAVRVLVLVPDPCTNATSSISEALQEKYQKRIQVALLAAAEALYVPLQEREHESLLLTRERRHLQQLLAKKEYAKQDDDQERDRGLLLWPSKKENNEDDANIQSQWEALHWPAKVMRSVTVCPVSYRGDADSQWPVRDPRQVERWVQALEHGRRVARDVGGSDPERMTPLRCAAYLQQVFHGTSVHVQVEENEKVLQREYPLLHAVARASFHVPRHAPCVVTLTLKGGETDSEVNETSHSSTHLFLVGKGITYDTGGADLKVNGHMQGMSRDKCGAATVAGFVAAVQRWSMTDSTELNITARLAFVRNSIGSDAYVSDEIIASRANVLVRVGNTDAEGRMVMTDLLAESRAEVEQALMEMDNTTRYLFITMATLTGHAVRAHGPAYTAVVENEAAENVTRSLIQSGTLVGDMFAKSARVTREDVAFVSSCPPHVLQANTLPSTQTDRGHQYPVAFMMRAAQWPVQTYVTHSEGQVTRQEAFPLIHLDIAGSAEESAPWGHVTARPLVALMETFVSSKI